MFKLWQGDCLEILRDVPGESVDCAVIDPPYKIISGGIRKNAKNECAGILNRRADTRSGLASDVKAGKLFKHNSIKFEEWLPELFRVMKGGTHAYLMVNARNLAELQTKAEVAGFKFQNLLIWDKGNVTPNKFYMQAYECVLMLRKGKARNINDMGVSNMVRVSNIVGKKRHPSEKPVELLEIMIENSTNSGDTVLDMFMGSGSTGVACAKTNRGFIGIELDPGYFKIAEQRITEAAEKGGFFMGAEVAINEIQN